MIDGRPCAKAAKRCSNSVAAGAACTSRPPNPAPAGWSPRALTEIAGSSDVVERGFVTYSNAAKEAMLGVPPATLERLWRRQRARRAAAMAAGALAHSQADLAVAITGIAGPGGGSKAKAGRACAFRRRTPRAAACSPASRGYGEIGRRRVRERSVAEALALLQALAEEGSG